MSAYVAARIHDTPDGPELELYEPPHACGQYPAHDTAAGAVRVLEVGGADRGTWGVVEVREVAT